ncbi:hypothetical protein ACFXGA_22825 [Actinosynnema sp. NPDC059335]|uniref:hypothetical protein n=1 Tax=Actinosynnema sp. NPDC059335 TaxID=3346804 RepID=UPI00366A6C8E
MGAVVWVLPVLAGLVLPLAVHGPPVGTSISLVVAGLLLKARQVHAEKPGDWFPLLVTGSTVFALGLGLGAAEWVVDDLFVTVGSSVVDLVRYLVGVATALGLGFWAWRARSAVVAVTAVAYLTAVQYLREAPVEDFGWFAYAPVTADEPAPMWLPPDVASSPELVLIAGAVFAYARLDRVRPWHVLAIVGLLGSLWHYSALALLVAAVVAAAYDLNARRPGAWYPLLLVGVGLAVWPVLTALTAPTWVDPRLEGLPDGAYTTLVGIEMNATAFAVSHVDHDESAAAFAVAAGLVVWAWRSRSPVVFLTAAAYAAAAYLDAAAHPLLLGTWQPPVELVVLAGAAVALATTTAPGAVRTAGRWAGRPGRSPGP